MRCGSGGQPSSDRTYNERRPLSDGSALSVQEEGSRALRAIRSEFQQRESADED